MKEAILTQLLEDSSRSKKKLKLPNRASSRLYREQAEISFKCQHCGYHVLAEPLLSGVRNRNHCPYCLWSRCLDLFEPGDRLSACKALMQPVGLALKKTRKKYGLAAQGELMLVHQCSECGKVSANRIAADDDPQLIFRLYANSLHISRQQADEFARAGVQLLDAQHKLLVCAQLFGKADRQDQLFTVLPVKQGLLAR